jgi:predicted Zn-dependent protease
MSLKALKKWLVVPAFFIASVHGATAAEKTVFWNLERLASSQDETILLKVPYQERALEVETLQLRVIGRTFLKLKDASELNPRLLLMSGQRPNAAAGPVDGVPTVLINTAMLDLVGYNPDEWAALLGHELAHLKLEHSAKGSNRDLMLDLLRAAVNSHFDYDIASQYGTQLLSELIDTKFSRDQERQSDYLGVIWALESDFDPYGATSLHTKLLRVSGKRPIPFLSSHPTSSERVESLNGLADRLTVN